MKEGELHDHFNIWWRYPGLGEVEIIPAIYSRTKKPVRCGGDLDCDDGIWCNGKFCFYVVLNCGYFMHETLSLFFHATIACSVFNDSNASTDLHTSTISTWHHQAKRRATAWGCVNSAHNGRALMDCYAPMTSVMKRPNYARIH
jgi:hypothetical protein